MSSTPRTADHIGGVTEMVFTDADLARFKKAFIDRTRIDAYSMAGPEGDLRALVERLEAAELDRDRMRVALERLSKWPTQTMLQTAKDLILKAREVAKIGLGQRK